MDTVRPLRHWSAIGDEAAAMGQAALAFADKPTRENRAAYLEARRLYGEARGRILADAPLIQEIIDRRLAEWEG